MSEPVDRPAQPGAHRGGERDGRPADRAAARRRQTVGDMVRSLAVVLVLVGVVVGLNMAQQPDPVLRDVEFPAALDHAQSRVDYDLAGPDPLPAGWRVTSARTGRDRSATTWHLGMVTARDAYAAVEQTDGPRKDLVEAHADGSTSAGRTRIGGRTWQRLTGGDPEPRALVLVADGLTTLVAGSASWAELRELAASLG